MADKDAWDLGGGGESFPFDRIGDEVEGFITDMDTRQGSDMQTGEPSWWDKEHTRPIMLTLVTLQTSLREGPKDSGLRTVTLAGSKKPSPEGGKSRMCAARSAVLEATGGTAMEPGAWFKMRFSSEGARTKPGFNPPKYFEAWYRPPVHDLDGQNRIAPVNQVVQQLPGQTYGPGAGPQPGANWPQQSSTGLTPAFTGTTTTNPGPVSVNTTTGEISGGNTTGDLTLEQVESVRALVGEEGLDRVYGPDWRSRVKG